MDAMENMNGRMNSHPLSKYLYTVNVANARGHFLLYIRKFLGIDIWKGGVGPIVQFFQICANVLVMTFYIFFNGPVMRKARHVRLAFLHLSG